MSEFKGTPGPWNFSATVVDHLNFPMVTEMRTIAGLGIASVIDDGISEVEQEANGRLIAAAPELLQACQAFVDAWTKSRQIEKTDVALRLAESAIAKAIGTS